MTQTKLILTFFALFFSSSYVFAWTLESNTQVSSTTQEETIGASGSFVDDKDLDSLLRDWDISGGSQKTKDTSTNQWSSGSLFSAGLGWAYQKKATLDMDLDYSKTPSEGLTTTAWTAELGYKKDLSASTQKAVDEEGDSFHQSLTSALRLGTSSFSQSSDIAQRRGATAQEKVLRQNMLGFAFTYAPISFMKARVGYEVYGYNKNVNQFVSTINQNSILALRWGGLSGALYDLNLWDSDLSLTFYPIDIMDIRLYYKYGVTAVDHTPNIESKLMLAFYVTDKLMIEPGYERYVSSGTGEDLALLTVAYDF